MKQFADLKTLLPILESSDLKLRQHQIDGIETVIKWINGGHGGIMADEMGLGKTCQAVITLALKAKVNPSAQFLIICPLSVIEHWENEIIRFGCGLLNLFVYKGYKEAREDLRSEFSSKTWNVCLTTYNYFRMDEYYFDFPIEIVIIDEAHSVKSQTSQLHQMIRHQKANFHLLLTGTPIQNDILEFYSLLSLSDNKSFRESDSARDRFLRLPRKELEKKLKDATEKYVLRRLKSEVCKELPSSEEVILLHSLTNFQKQLYNAVLVSNHEFFKGTTAVKQSLMNVLAQLRKAVAHPYLFPGIEPEPFKEGEHLITASGKFMVLDRLLAFLKPTKHRCLIFSQYARNLEILADVLSYRHYKYEYLDGSSKPEDRFQSIENFQKPNSDVFCFLISTKAGGQGLTLTAADTVIFLDSDYNPQNDLQAAARCHRIGQDKPVKVIRLLAEHSVDNVIRKRAAGKLKLSEFILDDNSESLTSAALREVLLSDLAKLNEATDCTEAYSELLTDDYFISQIGKTDKDGHWMNESVQDISRKSVERDDGEEGDEINLFPRSSPLAFLTAEDENAFEKIKAELEKSDSIAKKAVIAETPLNDRTNKHHNPELDEIWKEEKAKTKAKREEQEKKKNEKRQKLWDENDYASKSVTILGKTLDRQIEPEETGRFFRVVGNIAAPARDNTDSSNEAWILYSVDSEEITAKWGRGGLFAILDDFSSDISSTYNKAGEMHDLHSGDAHFIENIISEHETVAQKIKPKVDLDEDETKTEASEKLTQKISVLLMVAQNLRDRHKLALTESSVTRCFKAISDFALTRNELPSIHMPCIWHGVPNLNEKMVRKLAVKSLCKKGIDVYCYRYKKNYVSDDQEEEEVQEIPKPAKRPSSRTSTKHSPQPPKKKRRIFLEDEDDEEFHISEEEEEEALIEDDEENDIQIDEDEDEEVGEMDDFIVDDDEVAYDYTYQDDNDDDKVKRKSHQTSKKTPAKKKFDSRGKKVGSSIFSV